MDVSLTVWAITIGVILALFALDFVVSVRNPHEEGIREAALWSVFYIAVSVVFGLVILFTYGSQSGTEFFAGYLVEKSLSVDNLFVFVIIMSQFAVPKAYQHKVLLFGIAMALVMRAIFIAIGAAAIERFAFTFVFFGAFLIYTAIQLARHHDEDPDPQNSKLMKTIRRVVPATDEVHGAKLVVRENGKRVATPLALALLAIGATDLLFALDSIPAIYGLTDAPYIVFSANAFALLGLLQLYFLLGGLLDRLVYLGIGLSLILAFIGGKLIIHAMEANTLPFLNGGEPIEGLPHIETEFSLSVIVGILVVTTVLSLLKNRRDARNLMVKGDEGE